MKQASKRSDAALYRRILGHARPYRLHLAGVFAMSMLSTPLGLLAPLPLKIIVDSALSQRPLSPLLAWMLPVSALQSPAAVALLAAGLLVVVAILSQTQALVTSLLSTYTGEKLVLDLRARLFDHIQRLSVSYHDVKGSADSMFRIQWSAMAMQYAIIDGLVPFVSSAFTLIGMIFVSVRIDWRLAVVAFAVAPFLVALSRKYRPLLRHQSEQVNHLESSALSVIQEVLSSLRVVLAFGREQHEQERYLRRSTASMKARLRLAREEGTYGLQVGLTTALGTATVLCLGVSHVRSGVLTLGDLLLVMAYLGQLYEPLTTIGRKSATLQGHLASLGRAFELLDEMPEVVERPDAKPIARASGAIEFRNLSFAYRENHPVLHGISLDVPAGARVGIAGRTGAGKTTLVNLLARFYDPCSGQILLDGMDLREYKLADLRNQFAIVLQEPVLFSASLAENIAYARPSATEAEIVAAAKAANAHEFIVNLPEEYQTQVGERGMLLSGGERQRISLARAFLKDAPVLILDEPTSSVDVKTEAGIMEAMERLMQGRTTFMIAHRLGTLASCDVRVRIEHGRMVEVNKTGEAARSSTNVW